MTYTEIILDKQPPIAYIILNRPDQLNTLGPVIQEELNLAVLDIWHDPGIRVYVIKGAGRAFCAGFDVSRMDITAAAKVSEEEISDENPDGIRQNRKDEPWSITLARLVPRSPFEGNATSDDWIKNIWDSPKVSIAQVHGYCLGAGLMIANACDIVVGSEDSLYGYPPIRYGSSVIFSILPQWALTVRKLKEMAFTGNMIDAYDAYYSGLITRVIATDKLEDEVNRLARVASKVPYPANELSKVAINNYVDTTLARAFGLNWTQALNSQMEASTVPGNIWMTISQMAADKGGPARMYDEIREKFDEGDTLARENARKYSKKKE